jgi:hypothetical protein
MDDDCCPEPAQGERQEAEQHVEAEDARDEATGFRMLVPRAVLRCVFDDGSRNAEVEDVAVADNGRGKRPERVVPCPDGVEDERGEGESGYECDSAAEVVARGAAKDPLCEQERMLLVRNRHRIDRARRHADLRVRVARTSGRQFACSGALGGAPTRVLGCRGRRAAPWHPEPVADAAVPTMTSASSNAARG